MIKTIFAHLTHLSIWALIAWMFCITFAIGPMGHFLKYENVKSIKLESGHSGIATYKVVLDEDIVMHVDEDEIDSYSINHVKEEGKLYVTIPTILRVLILGLIGFGLVAMYLVLAFDFEFDVFNPWRVFFDFNDHYNPATLVYITAIVVFLYDTLLKFCGLKESVPSFETIINKIR